MDEIWAVLEKYQLPVPKPLALLISSQSQAPMAWPWPLSNLRHRRRASNYLNRNFQSLEDVMVTIFLVRDFARTTMTFKSPYISDHEANISYLHLSKPYHDHRIMYNMY